MKLTSENTAGKDVKVYDAMGRLIKGVIEFDTETFVGKMVVLGAFNEEDKSGPFPLIIKNDTSENPPNNILIIEVKLPGCYVTIDGKRV